MRVTHEGFFQVFGTALGSMSTKSAEKTKSRILSWVFQSVADEVLAPANSNSTDTVHSAAILEHDLACHQAIDPAILSPPLSLAKSVRHFLHHWRHHPCLVRRDTDCRCLSVLANRLLLAASRQRPLHPNDKLLHHTCLSEPCHGRRGTDSADSIHLADSDPKEQEALALCGLPARFIVRYALQYYPRNDENDILLTKNCSVCVTSVIRLQTLTEIDTEDITCQSAPHLLAPGLTSPSSRSLNPHLLSELTEPRVQRLPRSLERHRGLTRSRSRLPPLSRSHPAQNDRPRSNKNR